MSIAIWGYYGSNYGDDIMLEVILDYLKEQSVEVKLVDLYCGKLNYYLNNRYENVEVINFGKLSRNNKLRVLKTLANCKINVWGGGTIFTDSDGDGNFRFFSIIKALGGKIGYLGVGLGTLTKRERIIKTRMLLSMSSLTIFRDEKSSNMAKSLTNKKFYTVEDLSYIFFGKSFNKSIEKFKDDYILVTWRNLSAYVPFSIESKLMDELVDIIDLLIKDGKYKRVILSALDTNYDVESCRIISNKLTNKGIVFSFDIDSSIENITSLIDKAGFHFSGRLHGSVASEILGTPTLSLSYSPKIEYFYESINSNNFINIYNDTMNYEKINKIILDNKIACIDIEEKVSLAKKNFKYLSKYC